MRLIRDLGKRARTTGAWVRDLTNTFRELKKAIPSINEIQIPRVDDLPLDKISEVIAGLGVPGLVLVMLMTASPLTGAAAITSSLAALGPFGMLGGIATLGVYHSFQGQSPNLVLRKYSQQCLSS